MRLKKVLAVHDFSNEITIMLKCDYCGGMKQITAYNEAALFEESIPKLKCPDCLKDEQCEERV